MPIQTAIDSISNSQGSPFGFKNRIINGAMVIDQRNAGASITPTNGISTYSLDRWSFYVNQSSKLTTQQSSTAPSGFVNSLLVTSSSAYSVAASDQFELRQFIEGYNTADLMWGTANAQTVTLSFWVRSSLTGTFGGVIRNSASDRSYAYTYTISSANTFEYKTVTIAGDITGTWLTTNGAGIRVNFYIGLGTNFQGAVNAWNGGTVYGASGTTNLVSTNGSTFYLTGVQLEKGSTATSFDYRPYGTELQLAQRYYEKLPTGVYGTVAVRTTDWYGNIMWQVEKRTAPTCTLNGTINIVGSVGDINTQTPTAFDTGSTKLTRVYRSGSTFTTQAGFFYIPNYLELSAEL